MPSSVTFAAGVYIAFDFGTKNIGIAVGQTVTKTANPIATLKASHGIPNWNDVSRILEKWQPKGLIVGLPLQLDGKASKTSRLAARFAKQLQLQFALPVHTIEERLTSVAAGERNKDRRAQGIKATSNDALAACVILESWFNQMSQESNNACSESSV